MRLMISRINQILRHVCKEAIQFGQERLPDNVSNRRVVVILNPTANKRKAEKTFEKFCSPVLNLAGIRVDIIKTESEGFARSYVETELSDLPDAIVVAGGDGTLSEVVTGLMRRGASCPVAIVPVGRTNSVAGKMFPIAESNRVSKVEQLTQAAMSVIRGNIEKRDVLKIEILPEDSIVDVKKPVYAMASIKWGAFRDAIALRDRYWYYGGLREHASILFGALRPSRLNWNCAGTLTTTPACAGCQNCFENPSHRNEYQSRNWWSKLLPSPSKPTAGPVAMIDGEDVRVRINPSCGVQTKEELVDTNELFVTTNNVVKGPLADSPIPQMEIRLGSAKVGTFKWIQDSWRRTAQECEGSLTTRVISARTMELVPQLKTKADGSEEFYSIDNEAFEVKPIRVTLLPVQIHMLA